MRRLPERGIGFCSLRKQYLVNAAIVKVKMVGERAEDDQSEVKSAHSKTRKARLGHGQGEKCIEHGKNRSG